MASSGRKCLNTPDLFCYICGQFTIKQQRMNISDFVQKAYHAYFGMNLGDQDKNWAPHNHAQNSTWMDPRKETHEIWHTHGMACSTKSPR